MARKLRSDSTEEMVRFAQGAERQIAPPSHVPMQDIDWPFWESVVSEFARAEWTEHQLELAAMLARTMADLEENQRLLRLEGAVIERETYDKDGAVRRVVMVENSRSRSVHTFMGQVLALRRSLALHARAKSGTNHDAGKQRAAGKKIERQVSGELDLLA